MAATARSALSIFIQFCIATDFVVYTDGAKRTATYVLGVPNDCGATSRVTPELHIRSRDDSPVRVRISTPLRDDVMRPVTVIVYRDKPKRILLPVGVRMLQAGLGDTGVQVTVHGDAVDQVELFMSSCPSMTSSCCYHVVPVDNLKADDTKYLISSFVVDASSTLPVHRVNLVATTDHTSVRLVLLDHTSTTNTSTTHSSQVLTLLLNAYQTYVLDTLTAGVEDLSGTRLESTQPIFVSVSTPTTSSSLLHQRGTISKGLVRQQLRWFLQQQLTTVSLSQFNQHGTTSNSSPASSDVVVSSLLMSTTSPITDLPSTVRVSPVMMTSVQLASVARLGTTYILLSSHALNGSDVSSRLEWFRIKASVGQNAHIKLTGLRQYTTSGVMADNDVTLSSDRYIDVHLAAGSDSVGVVQSDSALQVLRLADSQRPAVDGRCDVILEEIRPFRDVLPVQLFTSRLPLHAPCSDTSSTVWLVANQSAVDVTGLTVDETEVTSSSPYVVTWSSLCLNDHNYTVVGFRLRPGIHVISGSDRLNGDVFEYVDIPSATDRCCLRSVSVLCDNLTPLTTTSGLPTVSTDIRHLVDRSVTQEDLLEVSRVDDDVTSPVPNIQHKDGDRILTSSSELTAIKEYLTANSRNNTPSTRHHSKGIMLLPVVHLPTSSMTTQSATRSDVITATDDDSVVDVMDSGVVMTAIDDIAEAVKSEEVETFSSSSSSFASLLTTIPADDNNIPYVVHNQMAPVDRVDVHIVQLDRNIASSVHVNDGGQTPAWNDVERVSPTVIAVLTSLGVAIFFVIACIMGFVVSEFVCGSGTGSSSRRLLGRPGRGSRVSPYLDE